MKPETARRRLRSLLKASGVDAEPIRVSAVWAIFKQFCAQPSEYDAGVLFECGTYDFTGPSLFSLSFVRQFQLPGDDEFFQLSATLYREPDGATEGAKTFLWSSSFPLLDRFFAAVERLEQFRGTARLECWTLKVRLDHT